MPYIARHVRSIKGRYGAFDAKVNVMSPCGRALSSPTSTHPWKRIEDVSFVAACANCCADPHTLRLQVGV